MRYVADSVIDDHERSVLPSDPTLSKINALREMCVVDTATRPLGEGGHPQTAPGEPWPGHPRLLNRSHEVSGTRGSACLFSIMLNGKRWV